MEPHVTSRELSERLKKLGVPQKSNFYWYENVNVPEYEKDCDNFYLEFLGDEKPQENPKEYRGCRIVASAYLSSEIGKFIKPHLKKIQITVTNEDTEESIFDANYWGKCLENDLSA